MLQAPGSAFQASLYGLQAQGARLQGLCQLKAPCSRLLAPDSTPGSFPLTPGQDSRFLAQGNFRVLGSGLQAPGSRLTVSSRLLGSRFRAPGSNLQAPCSILQAWCQLRASGSRLQDPCSGPGVSKGLSFSGSVIGSRLQFAGSRFHAPGSRVQAPGSWLGISSGLRAPGPRVSGSGFFPCSGL
uniref:Uncharacterized protein n=1 Tax=Sphaeramia orbicularis TaxID=375764 RepID=A0A673BHY7_9TELE